MQVLVLVAIVAAVQIVQAADPSANALAKQKLFKDKAVGYNLAVDPGHGTVIKAGLSFVCVKLDEKSHKLTARVYERYTWRDQRLGWNPAQYDGVKHTSAPISLVWKPDFRLFNAFANSEERDEVNAVYLADGTVYWIPPATYHSLCTPSEDEKDHSHHCRLTLGAWSYDGPSLPLQLFDAGIEHTNYLKECPYLVKNARAAIAHTRYPGYPQPFDRLDVTFDVVENDHHDDDHHDDDDDDDKKDHDKCRWPHC